MFDKRGIMDHLRELEQAMGDWRRYQNTSLKELREDRDKRNMVSHALLVSIQGTIDIANHLIVERSLEKPSTYRESFQILSSQGVIPTKLADSLSDLAGFRNVLVHLYWELNLEEVHGVLKSGLTTIEKFKKVVKRVIK